MGWKAEADRINFIGVLLTALTLPHWGRRHPFWAINGNKPGVGKPTLAKLLGALMEGRDPATVSWVPSDEEFEKRLATRVEAGDRVIIIDNARTRRTISSAVLERAITDARPNFRRLGSNTSISRSRNDLLFCLTMNMTQLGQDLRRRALLADVSGLGRFSIVDSWIGWDSFAPLRRSDYKSKQINMLHAIDRLDSLFQASLENLSLRFHVARYGNDLLNLKGVKNIFPVRGGIEAIQPTQALVSVLTIDT